MRRSPIPFPTPRQSVRSSMALAGLLVCCFGMWSVARAGLSRLLSVYGSSSSQLASVDQALRWSPSDPEVHHARALVLADMGENKEALKEFERAIELRPEDYYLWLELGHAREEVEDEAGAGAAFREAVRLAPDYAQPHWQLGNFILRTGELDEAFVEMRRAVGSNATLFPALIDLAWGACEGDSQAVLQAVRPQTDAARLALARFFAAHQETEVAINLFRNISSNVGAEDRRSLVSELLAAGNFPEAHEVWFAGAGNNSGDRSIFFDGGFEHEINVDEAGFGWKPFRGAKTVRFGLDVSERRSGARSLRLEYAGNFDPATPIISQLVLVKPHTRYRLTFATRSQDLVTAALPVVIVTSADSEKKRLAQSDALARGTSGWHNDASVFVTPDTTRAVLICIQRQTCDVSPCPIFGRVWFDDFLLEEE